ncbi:hypothetical protein SAMN06265379_103416 [Saccharicrinis carchari]|uniref:Uncharacterized protein n=1 Tax=Saccharicrinis carchari TaxID=1168039 RepID=A0A521CS02_SACCC|nr:outer membrane beta-barrel protein [Saccharicrinis carchari]SMO62259.1 hypothetical protein SAMN06265379_103416 [Saccharicrinis carchari]
MHQLLKVTTYLCLFGMFFQPLCKAQNKVLWGGGVSAHIPTNSLSTNNFGFRDAAGTGGGANMGTLWFFNPQLSLGSELAYSYFPRNQKTWNQQRRGDIKVNYQMLNLTAQGNFYLNEGGARPYLGVAFGLYYLRNMVNFISNYVGTTNDASVTYVSNTFHAGFGPEAGVLFKRQKNRFAHLSLRYTIIPNIEAEYYPEKQVTINPHGKQNHWSLSVKMFFGKR